jgi:hypothetical protein
MAILLPGSLVFLAELQEQGSIWPQVQQMLQDKGLEVLTLLLAFTLSIFLLLVFAVRVLLILRKLPVPADPVDMARPRGFRAIMLGFASVLTPLMASQFLPQVGLDRRALLVTAYAIECLLAVALWFLLDLFYAGRGKRSQLDPDRRGRRRP